MLENYKMTKVNIINMENKIQHLENYNEKQEANNLKQKIDSAKLEVDSLDRAIEGLSAIDRSIIKGFYIDDMMWWQVAYSVGYSEGHCKKRRVSAINEMVKGVYGARER